MEFLRKHVALVLFSLCCSCTDMACMEQYNPQNFWDQLKEEEKIANQEAPTLTKDGKLKEPL